MLAKFKATFDEVTGVVAEAYPYFEFYVNVMGNEVMGVTKILKISNVNPADYLLVSIDSFLVDKAKSLWPVKFSNKDYVELNSSII